MTQAQTGAIWNSLGSAMYAANSFLMLALVGRVGSVAQTGAFGIAFTTAQLLYIVGLFGVSHIQMTDYTHRYGFGDYGRVRILSCCIMLLGCGGAALALGFTGDKLLYTVLLTIFMLVNVVGDLFQILFFQNNRLDLSGSALFFRTLWPLLLFAVCLVVTKNILLSLVLQILCNLWITLFYIRRVAPPFLQQERLQSRTPVIHLLQECVPLFISLVLMSFVINCSKYAIEFLMDDTAQGYYNMIFLPAFVIGLCSQFLFRPLLNRYAQLMQQRDWAAYRRQLLLQVGLLGLLTLLACAGAALLGVPVLNLFFQKDLTPFVLPLVLVVLGGGLYATCDLLCYLYVMLRQKQMIFCIYIGATILAIPLTLLFVHLWGLTGAAISFVVIHALILAAYALHFHLWLKLQT